MTSSTLTPPAERPDWTATAFWIAATAFLAAGSYLLARYIQLGPVQGPWAYWPIQGLLCGILFRRGYREWGYITVAAVVAQVTTIYLVRGDLAGGATPIGAIAGAIQASLGALILRHFSSTDGPLENPRDLAVFVLVGVIFAPLVVTPIAAMAFAIGLDLPFQTAWWPLFVGNSLSMLLFAPFAMQRWQPTDRRGHWLAGTAEAASCLALLVLVGLVAFDTPIHWVAFVALPYAVFPLLAWAALRSGPLWTAISIIVLATIASWYTARGHGPFARAGQPLDVGVLQLEAYLAFVAFTGLLLSALTEQRRRSFATMAMDEAIRSAFFESSSAVIVMKDLEGRYVMVNRAAEQVFGVPRDQLIGRHPADFLDAASTRVIEAHDRRMLERGEPLTFEETLGSADRERIFLTTRFPVPDGSGTTRYLGMIGRDETIERELSARLQSAQRVDMLGQLAAGVAHDLNNLLFVLVGNTHELRARPGLPAEEQEMLQEMVDAGAQATRLTARLLSLGRATQVPRGPVEVDHALRELTPLLNTLVRDRIDITMRLGAPGARVVTDATAIEQIVLNLVANARDAIPEDGRILISTELVDTDAGTRTLRLSVADTGEGMNAATLARVFEPFFTTKGAGRGTGIGLYTTSLLVQQSGGTARATSEPGQGATFVVELPVAG